MSSMSAETATLGATVAAEDAREDVANDARGISADAGTAAGLLPSLKARALRGSAWTIFDYFVGKALSLASSMMLTRLLVPHEKGLMDICNIVITGLQMFSDIGIGPNIIFSRRGDKPEFLNTAWTIQVFRGAALFLFTGVAAWPVARLYHEPRLLYLLPVCGFTSLLLGFTSTSLVMLNRQMRLGLITVLDIIAQVLSIGVMVAWALVSPTVWSLVAGAYVMTVFRVGYSHMLVREHTTRFQWNREDARSMFRFGRWIFLSTVLTFFARDLDKLLFAAMLGVAANAVYGIAAIFSVVPQQLIKKIGAQVAFPVLAEVARDRPDELPHQFKRVRYPLVAMSLACVTVLILVARPMINLLYTSDWQHAGPILRILAVGAMGGLLNSTYGSALLAMGKTFQGMALLASQIVFLVAATLLGYRLHPDPEMGFIWGVALVEWLNYPVTAAVMARYGLFQPKIDAAAIVTSAAAIALAFWVL